MFRQIPFRTQVMIVIFGIPATITFDIVAGRGLGPGTTIFVLTLIARLFTYVILFASFRPIAEALAEMPGRVREAASLWFLVSIGMAVFTWAWMGRVGQIGGETLILFGPGAVDDQDLAVSIAERAFGAEVAGLYGWGLAIAAQAMGLAAAASAAALFALWCAQRGQAWIATATPVVATMALVIYAFLVPWVFHPDDAIYIGDVLVGGLILNAMNIPTTLILGGVTAPAIWVGALALANLALLRHWAGPLANPWDRG